MTSFSFLVFSHFASFISSFGLIIAIQFKMWPNTITLSAHKHTKRHIYVLEKKIVHTYNICRIKLDNIIRIVWKDRFYSDNIKILKRIHNHSNTQTHWQTLFLVTHNFSQKASMHFDKLKRKETENVNGFVWYIVSQYYWSFLFRIFVHSMYLPVYTFYVTSPLVINPYYL